MESQKRNLLASASGSRVGQIRWCRWPSSTCWRGRRPHPQEPRSLRPRRPPASRLAALAPPPL